MDKRTIASAALFFQNDAQQRIEQDKTNIGTLHANSGLSYDECEQATKDLVSSIMRLTQTVDGLSLVMFNCADPRVKQLNEKQAKQHASDLRAYMALLLHDSCHPSLDEVYSLEQALDFVHNAVGSHPTTTPSGTDNNQSFINEALSHQE